MAENYIKKLQRENEELKAKLAESPEVVEPETQIDPNDYRLQNMEVVYGPNRQNLIREIMPVQQAFDKLIEFYSQFELSTNKQVARELNDEKGNAEAVNQNTVYCRIKVRDKLQKKEVETIREVPFWLAVDKVLLQDQRVELISKKEWDEWMTEKEKEDIRYDTKTKEIIRREIIRKQVMAEEMAKTGV